ncbi:hypothetical protein ACFLU5_17590 [Bacteroidota bacterium]
MGQLFKAICENCSFEKDRISTGCGMIAAIPSYPYLDKKRKKIYEMFPHDKHISDTEDFIPYYKLSTAEIKGESKSILVNWRSFEINEQHHYLCPKCGEYKLKFIFYALWD